MRSPYIAEECEDQVMVEKRAVRVVLATCLLMLLSAGITAGQSPSSALGASTVRVPGATSSVALGTKWIWRNPLPQGNALQGVSCLTGRTCLAVGDSGTLLSSADDGTTWIPLSSGTDNNLSAITCPTARTCLLAGSGGTILQSAN
jgi:photosystem II stability/assembly factor-like uncharacterized protein